MSNQATSPLLYGSIPNKDDFASMDDWYRNCVASVVNHYEYTRGSDYFNASYTNVQKYIQLLKYYFGEQENVSYKFMEEVDEGISAPAEWLPGKKVGTLIDHMKGNFIKMLQSYRVNAFSLSEDAVNEKQRMLDDYLMEVEMQDELGKIEEQIGESVSMSDGPKPETEEQVRQYVKNYKRYSEKLIYNLVNQVMTTNQYQEVLSRLFVHVIIFGVCGLKVSVYNGKLVWEPVNPINLFFDKGDNDLQRNMKYAGRQYWASIGEVFERFDLDSDEKDEIWRMAKDRAYANSGSGAIFTNLSWHWYKDDDEFYVRVAEAEWLYPEVERQLKTVDKYGNEHFGKTEKTELTERQKEKGHEIVEREMEYAYTASLIGGRILKNNGLRPNQPRSSSNITQTELSYHVFTPNIEMGHFVSPAEKLIQHQERVDMYNYKIQEAVAHDYGRILKVDTSQLDPDVAADPNELAVWIKTNAMVPYNSAENELQFGGRAQGAHYIDVLDLSISPSVQYYQQMIQFEHQQMEEIASIPKAALGQQHAYQPENVQRQAITQSSISNYSYYKMFGEYTNKILQYSGNVGKILFAMEQNNFPVFNLSDTEVDFLGKLNREDIMWEDMLIYVDVDDIPTEEDKQDMVRQAQAAMQNQMIDYLDYLNIKKAKTYSEAYELIEQAVKEKKEEQRKLQQIQDQSELKKEIAKIKAETKAELQKELQINQQEFQHAAQRKKMESDANVREAVIQNKNKLNEETFRKLMELEKEDRQKLAEELKSD
jgi:hypothetical protein